MDQPELSGGWRESGHHSLSHHRDNAEKVKSLAKIDRHVTLFAHLVERLKTIPEGALLDNSMVVYGGAIGDGNRHTHYDLPVLMAGKGNGAIKRGGMWSIPR